MKEVLLISSVSIFILACVTEPQPPHIETVEEPPPEKVIEEIHETPDDTESEDQEFEVTQSMYEQAFEEIEELIAKLNSVIARGQFNRWKTFISQAYSEKYSSDETLNEYNQYPQLLENNIVLTSLEDYFKVVVVPSRSQAVLKEIVFVSENKIVAYSSFDGKRAKLYELEKIDGMWKISVW